MSALPPKADIDGRPLDVRFVPIADITARHEAFDQNQCSAFVRHLRLSVRA
jgi:hypothetical protein